MAVEAIAVYGAGGFAREVAWLIKQLQDAGRQYRFVGYIDDDLSTRGSTLFAGKVNTLADVGRDEPGALVVAAAGAPATRRGMIERARAAGLRPATLIHPRAEISDAVAVGEGVVICAGNILTVDISIGDFVQINLDCTIGHDVTLGEYATLAPGVHISGWVRVGNESYVGTGATVINGTRQKPLTIGDGAIVGAGACVVRDVPAGQTVVGVPARPRS